MRAAFARAGRGRSASGFALLIVLWALVLVSLLILQLSEEGGAEARLGDNLRRGAIAEAAADGAFAEAAFRLMDRNPGAWSVAGGTHVLAVPGGRAVVTVANEAGKVDLNNASPVLLAALIQTVGASSDAATAIAQSIVAWHTVTAPNLAAQAGAPYLRAHRPYAPPLAPFETVGELALVDGVTPALFQALLPHVTVFQGGDPVLALADPVVRRAAASAGETEAPGAPDLTSDDVVALRVEAKAGGGRFTRLGVVQLEPGEGGAAYRVLDWRRG